MFVNMVGTGSKYRFIKIVHRQEKVVGSQHHNTSKSKDILGILNIFKQKLYVRTFEKRKNIYLFHFSNF